MFRMLFDFAWLVTEYQNLLPVTDGIFRPQLGTVYAVSRLGRGSAQTVIRRPEIPSLICNNNLSSRYAGNNYSGLRSSWQNCRISELHTIQWFKTNHAKLESISILTWGIVFSTYFLFAHQLLSILFTDLVVLATNQKILSILCICMFGKER